LGERTFQLNIVLNYIINISAKRRGYPLETMGNVRQHLLSQA